MKSFMRLIIISWLPFAVRGGIKSSPASINCTDAASKSVSWAIKNFTVDTDTEYDFGPGTLGKATFTIANTADNYEFNCLQGDGSTGRVPNRRVIDGKVWYSCNVYCKGARGVPEEDDPSLSTSFHFDMGAKALSISQTWSCGSGNTSTL